MNWFEPKSKKRFWEYYENTKDVRPDPMLIAIWEFYNEWLFFDEDDSTNIFEDHLQKEILEKEVKDEIINKWITKSSVQEVTKLLNYWLQQEENRDIQYFKKTILKLLDKSSLDKPIIKRLYTIDKQITHKSFQSLILLSYLLSNKSYEHWVRKTIFHTEFCKNNRASLERNMYWNFSSKDFDINDFSQQWFQRIRYNIWLKDWLEARFYNTIIRNNNIAEESQIALNNSWYIIEKHTWYYYTKSKKKFIDLSINEKKKLEDEIDKNTNDLYWEIIETLRDRVEDVPGFYTMSPEIAILNFQLNLQDQFAQMNFKERVIAIQFLLKVLTSTQFSHKTVKKRQWKEQGFRNELITKEWDTNKITFDGEVKMDFTWPWIICYFETLKDALKVHPEYMHQEIIGNRIIAWVHPWVNFKKSKEKFEDKIICIILENHENIKEWEIKPTMDDIIDHELFHIYQWYEDPIHKTITSVNDTQIEIRRELSARVRERYEYSKNELFDIAQMTSDFMENRWVNNEIDENRIRKQIEIVEELNKSLWSKKASHTLRRYLYKNRSNIPT